MQQRRRPNNVRRIGQGKGKEEIKGEKGVRISEVEDSKRTRERVRRSEVEE